MGGAGELSRVPLTQLRQRPHEPYDRSHRPSRDDFMPEQPDHLDRGTFLNLAAVVEAGLLLLAWLFGWLAGIDILSDVHINFSGLAWGVAATIPLFALFLLAMQLPWKPLRRVRQLLLELLGPSLALCKWYDLVLLAALAGVCEELMFRGFLQTWLIRVTADVPGLGDGWIAGVALTSILFGLAHWVTPTYGWTVMVMGVYLGLLPHCTDRSNLVIPIVTHGLYDYLAFLIVVRLVRRQPTGSG